MNGKKYDLIREFYSLKLVLKLHRNVMPIYVEFVWFGRVCLVQFLHLLSPTFNFFSFGDVLLPVLDLFFLFIFLLPDFPIKV